MEALKRFRRAQVDELAAGVGDEFPHDWGNRKPDQQRNRELNRGWLRVRAEERFAHP